MSIGNFVAFLRAALVNIGLTKEEAALFAGQSARAGGATEAAAKGLHQEDFNTWLASPPRNGSPGTTAETSRSGFASHAPSASKPLKRKVGVWGYLVFGQALPPPHFLRRERASDVHSTTPKT